MFDYRPVPVDVNGARYTNFVCFSVLRVWNQGILDSYVTLTSANRLCDIHVILYINLHVSYFNKTCVLIVLQNEERLIFFFCKNC